MGLKPPKSCETVINGSRKAIFGSETVVRGDDESRKLGGKAEAVILAIGPGAGADAEAATVDVEKDGKLGRRNVGRFVETEVQVVDRVKEKVFP